MKKFSTELKWGVIFAIATLLWMGIEKAMGWHGEHIEQHPTMTNLFAIIAIALYVFALLDKRKRDFRGSMTWMQGFVSGVIISVVVAVLSPLTQWITHTYISPEYFDNMIDYSVKAGYYNTEVDARTYFNLQAYVLQSAVGALLMGVVTSAIVAIFVRNK
jgi:hypothetical protein